MGSASDGSPIPEYIPWLTQAGQGNVTACNMYPVGGYIKALSPTMLPTSIPASSTGAGVLGPGVIAGIVVGSVVCVGAVMLAAFYYFFYARRAGGSQRDSLLEIRQSLNS